MSGENGKDQNTIRSTEAVNDWDGPDDSGNPRNFSASTRIASILAVTFLAFCSTFAASVYSPGISEVASTFEVSDEVATLPLSLFNLGLAYGPLLGSTLSEQFGRKVVFMITSPIFILFTLGSGLATDFTTLNVCRFFAAVFASPAVSNASASITDYTDGNERAQSLLFYYSIPTSGALLGPLIGGFVVLGKNWRWTQYTTIFFVAAAYIPVMFTSESYKKTILRRRAKKLAKSRAAMRLHDTSFAIEYDHGRSHKDSFQTEQVKQDEAAGGRYSLIHNAYHFCTVLLIRPIHMLLTEPIVTLVCVYSGFLFGLLYTFVIASPWIFEHYYDFSPAAQSLSFLSLVIGSASAPIPMLIIDKTMVQPRFKRYQSEHGSDSRLPPELRLMPALIASLMMPTSLFIFAWTVRPSIHWMVPIVFQGIAMLSSVMIYAPTNLFMIDSYGPLYGASASGAAMLSRYALSAAFPLFTLQMYRALGVGWATTLLAFCTLAMTPIPWLFYRYGSKLRSKSKYELSE